MLYGVYFHPQAMSAAQYDEVVGELEAAGLGQPAGRIHHSCFGPPHALMVYEVWDSPENFSAYAPTLVAIFKQVGVDASAPAVMPLHNMIE